MRDKQRVLGINTKFHDKRIENFAEFSFSDKVSYLDYDIAIINVSLILGQYKEMTKHENKPVLTKDSSLQINEDFFRLNEQIVELLKHGKNIYIFMGNNESFYFINDYRYILFDVYAFLPFDIKVTRAHGERGVVCAKQPYVDFFRNIEVLNNYSAYFDIDSSNILMELDADKILSAVMNYEKGKIILLPCPWFSNEIKEKLFWIDNGENIIEKIVELNERLCTTVDDYVLPQWADSFKVLNEEEEERKLKQQKEELANIQRSIKEQEKTIEITKRYKTLLTSSGVQLEEIVKIVLSEIGFTLMEAEQGRSDIIAKYNEKNIVAEVKGVTKSAAEKHAAQLEKWVSQFIEEYNSIPKALLIVNGYCDLPLSDRLEDVFPNQMLKYSEKRGHCLITTTQLLCLFLDIKQNPETANRKIMELLESEGKYLQYQNYEDYL